MISPDRLADVFVEVADTLVDDFDLVDFLHRLADHAAEISGWSAVGLMLTDLRGELRYMASSTADARHLELWQLQDSEGPCLDCFLTGEQVASAELESEEARWPLFAPRAVDAGFHSVHAFPLRLRDRVIGAMNAFAVEPEPLPADSVLVVQALADVATIAIIQEQALASADHLTQQLQYALNSRVTIEQAKGAVARALDIGVDEAFVVLRAEARNRRRRLTDLAQEVVTSPEAMNSLTRKHLGARKDTR